MSPCRARSATNESILLSGTSVSLVIYTTRVQNIKEKLELPSWREFYPRFMLNEEQKRKL